MTQNFYDANATTGVGDKCCKFYPSSRLLALTSGSSKSVGASCNTYKLQDSIDSIADSSAWSCHVLAYQGAPSVDFSNLRPRNSPISSGGFSSGAASFCIPFDARVSTMRRAEKKNGAGAAGISCFHKDLPEFLSLPLQAAYRIVYIPMHGTPEAKEFLQNKELLKTLAKAYNEFKCFLVKKPLPIDGEEMLVNLCTEVELPHRGTCVLGAHNLSAYSSIEDFRDNFASDFRNSAYEMLQYFNVSTHAIKGSPLECTSPLNRQFGLGIFGLASFLGDFGITYQEFGDTLEKAFDASADDLKGAIDFLSDTRVPVDVFTRTLLQGYLQAAYVARPHVRAAFCIQPTVSTAQRAFDSRGYFSSPEVQPVIGIKHEEAVSTLIKSAIKGDRQVNYSPNTWTIDEVPYEHYAKVSNGLQRLLDSTGLGHRHSHCYYGRAFSSSQLKRYYTDPAYNRIKSLYYRLPSQVNTESLRKDVLWQDVEEGELGTFDINALVSSGSCQMFTTDPSCDCTM